MGLIEGQVAILAGGGNEVAQGVARRFAREGAKVVIVDRDEATAREAARRVPGAEAHAADMTEPATAAALAQAVADRHGRIDILVNATHPALKWARLDDKPAAEFTAAFDEVVLSAVNGMKAVRPFMARAGGGRIVNLGSIYGPSANEGVSDAVTMDGALAALTRAAGVEWAKDGVLVNFLQPGLPDIAVFADYRAGRPDSVSALLENTPLQRLADPVEDIGGAALFLVCDEACFIVGHKLFADGGQHLTAAVFEPGAAR
jgi:NAD(P)-dependent dehydrogenase (short-subunit alcohol dehydrogenase family)